MSLGYEPYDMRLRCPRRSRICTLISTDRRSVFVSACCISPVSTRPAASRAQTVHKSVRLACGFRLIRHRRFVGQANEEVAT
jgi:hypothetical protein